jgi:hypothetical protein
MGSITNFTLKKTLKKKIDVLSFRVSAALREILYSYFKINQFHTTEPRFGPRPSLFLLRSERAGQE